MSSNSMSFTFSMRSTRQRCQDVENELVSRTVLLMIYSPSKYISSQAKSVLSSFLRPNAKDDIKYLLNTLDATSSGATGTMSDSLQVLHLISISCYSGLPRYRRYVMKNQGINILLSFIVKFSRNHAHTQRVNASVHYCDHNMKMCCYDFEEEDWEGDESFMVFGLLALAELVHHSGSVKDHGWLKSIESQLTSQVQKICIDSFASGPKWYCAYLLSYFGLYGFPSKLGNRIRNALGGDEMTNCTLVLANQEHVNVHGVVLHVRCPSLFPSDWKASRKNEIRLSAHVNHEALLKLLEFVYSGCFGAGEDLVRKLKTLAKHCNLQPLFHMLCRNRPKWRTPFPAFDLTSALGPNGFRYSDIVLEPKVVTSVEWKCESCPLPQLHLHAHKAVLCASSEHMRALLCSGMQESQSEKIKIDLGWTALVKLVNWLYSGKLVPKPKHGCLWHNLDDEGKLEQMIPYMELYCLSDSWLLEELHKECSTVIVNCLDSVNVAVKIIQISADCCQWDLVDLAAKFLAPSYHHLRNTGQLQELDEQLADMVRTASVARLSQ